MAQILIVDDEEKIRFYEIWKEKNIEELMQKFSTDEELMLAVDIENKAFDKAYKSCKSVIGDFTIDSFAKKYEKELLATNDGDNSISSEISTPLLQLTASKNNSCNKAIFMILFFKINSLRYLYFLFQRLPVITHIIFVVIFQIIKICYCTKIIKVHII